MKSICKHASVAVIALAAMGTSTGCVGPSKLRRGLDERGNQHYVDNPLLAQFTSPLWLTAEAVAAAVDVMLINPVFWWQDALEGQGGTPYYYRNPTLKGADESDE